MKTDLSHVLNTITHQHHHQTCKLHLPDLGMNMGMDFQFHDSNVVVVVDNAEASVGEPNQEY